MRLIAPMLAFGLILSCLAPAAAVAAPNCSDYAEATGGCVTPGVGSGEVTLGAEGTVPGAPGGGGGSGQGGQGGTGGNGSGGGAAPVVDPVCAIRQCFTVTSLADVVAARGPITLADIAHFRPTPGVDHMEPNGWMVVGLDTNFFATGGQEVVDGELLGFPASVRFTPIAWTWRYGDGATATRATPGATWAALGAEEFDATATSHVYRDAGTYVIDLDIRYRAEYRFAGLGWTAIAGSITLPANRLIATAGDARTVLVDKECTRNPGGPGC